MNTKQIGADAMIERSAVEAVLARVAVAAFQYYPTKSVDELGWTVDEDLDWALAPIRSLPTEQGEEWRRRCRKVILDPTADRRAFTRELLALADDRA